MTSWRIIYRSIRTHPGYWLLHATSMVVFMLLIHVQAQIIGAFFSTLDGSANLSLLLLIGALFGARLLRNLMQFLFTRANPPFVERAAAALRRHILVDMTRRPAAERVDYSVGDIVSRFRSDAVDIPVYLLWLNESIALALFSMVAVGTMLTINAPITIIALVPLIVVVFIARASAQRIERYRHVSQHKTARVAEYITETFAAVQAVKVAGKEESILRQFDRLNWDRQSASLRDRLFNQIVFSISNNSTSLSTGLILLLSADLLLTGSFEVADFAIFVYYLEQLSWFIGRLGIVLARHRQLRVAIARLNALTRNERLDVAPQQATATREGSSAPLQTLAIRDLSYTYPGTSEGITGVDLTVQRGTLTVITGEIGSGKSTLLRVLQGILPFDAGTIAWNGQPIPQPQAFFRPPHSAYTPQVPNLFSVSLRENILLDCDYKSAIAAAVEQTVLTTDIATLADGLDTVVGPRGVRLSGGQRQRAAAARMLIRDADLLIFDDISSALDIQTELQLWENIRRSGKTCIAVSSRPLALEQADQVIEMRSGRVAVTS